MKKTVFHAIVSTGIIQSLVPFQKSPFLSQTHLQLYSTGATKYCSLNYPGSVSLILFTMNRNKQNINKPLQTVLPQLSSLKCKKYRIETSFQSTFKIFFNFT